jgi:CxxC motif-containing protein
MGDIKRKMRCIICPEGCSLIVEYDKNTGGSMVIEGHKCKRGIKFAEDEIKNPLRTLTTTVRISSKKAARLAVRSNIPVGRDKMLQIIKIVRQIEIKAPVNMGDIIIHDVLGTGADIISCSSIKE